MRIGKWTPAASDTIVMIVAALCIVVIIVLAGVAIGDRGGNSLEGYCYGVMDSQGQMHPSATAPVSSHLGLVTKVPQERVVYVHDPVYTVADTQCICEQGLEDLPEEECE